MFKTLAATALSATLAMATLAPAPAEAQMVNNQGEIEDIDPGKGGEVILELEPGDYELACVIVPGEGRNLIESSA